MNSRLLLVAMVFSVVSFASGQVGAQSAGTLEEAETKGYYKIDFEGGSLDDYIKLLREIPSDLWAPSDSREGKGMNVVVTNNARDFQLPPIQVTTNAEGALGLVEACSTESQQVVVDADSSGSIQIIRVISEETPEVLVVNVKALLKDVDQAAMLSSIEIGLEMLDSDSVVSMKLHEETGLLFVKGMGSGTKLVNDVIVQLKDAHLGDANLLEQMLEGGMGGMGGMGMGMGMGRGNGSRSLGAPSGGGRGMASPGGGGGGRSIGAPGGAGGGSTGAGGDPASPGASGGGRSKTP